MRALITLVLLPLAGPAPAQADMGTLLQGQFGSASDPAASCGANPHRLAIIDNRPHLARIWENPIAGGLAPPRLREVFDLVAQDGMALTLSQEAPYLEDPDDPFAPAEIWVMQFTQRPQGYCWRRPGWPSTRCMDQQLRCVLATS